MSESRSAGEPERKHPHEGHSHLAASRDLCEQLWDASTLEEVASIAVALMEDAFAAEGAVMVVAAGADAAAREPWVSDAAGTPWAQLPEPVRHGLLELALASDQPVAETADWFLARGLPAAPALRNVLTVPLHLGTLRLGAVLAYNLAETAHLRAAEEAAARFGPVANAVGMVWMLDARAHSARQLECILEHTASHIAYLDRDFRFLRVNTAYALGSGHTKEELIGRNHFDLFPNEENRRVFEQVRDTGVPVQFLERPFAYANQPGRGVTYWDWTLAPVLNQRGEVEALVLSLTDRTLHVRQRQQLVAAEGHRLREARVTETILENASSAVVYLACDYTILRANPAGLEAMGLSREAVVGHSLFEFLPDLQRHAPVARVAEVGESVSFRQMPIYLPGQPRRPAYWDWAMVPVQDEQGKVEGIVLTANEVTEEVHARQQIARAERARAREARLLETIQESTEQTLIYLDRNLHVVQANSAFWRMAARSREEGRGRPLVEVLPEAQDYLVVLRRVLASAEAVTMREMSLPAVRPDGAAPSYWDFVITPVRDDRGVVEGIVVAGNDVTEEIEIRQRLVEEERQRTRLAETLTTELNHRVKNNLAMVAGLLSMQIAGLPPGDAAAAMIRQAIQRVQGLAVVHEQLHETQRQHVEMVDAIQRLVNVAQETVADARVRVSVEGAPASYPSRPATTVCLLVNELITNAMKHGGTGPEGTVDIRVTVGRGERGLSIEVWNSGAPVPADFNPAASAHIGLQVVRGVVEQFGGTFSLAPDGQGNRARLLLDEWRLWEA